MAYSQNLPSTVLEAGSAKSRCQQGRFSLGAVRQDVVQPLSPSGALLAVSGVGSQLDHPNPSSRGSLLLSCLSASFLCKRRAVMLGQGLPGGASGEESTCQSRRCKSRGLDPWVGKIPWKRRRHPTPPQDSCLENPMDRGAWWATVHGVTKSRTQLKRLGTAHIYT